MARILVAGCGYVGSELARVLVAEGHQVWGLRRRPQALPQGVRAAGADLTQPARLAELFARSDGPRGLDVVVYAAAADGGDEAAYRRAYVDGPRNLLEALRRAGERPRRSFFTSSTGVYAQDDGSWVDEDSPTEPTSFRGARVLEGERLLLASEIPATVVRLGGIYGPGRTRLAERVRRGEAELPTGPTRWTNRIHRDDAAGILRHLIALELAGRSPGAVYVGVDDEPASQADVLRWLARRLGVELPDRAESPAAPTSARAPGRNKRCRNARIRALGYRFRYPTFREGYEALLSAP